MFHIHRHHHYVPALKWKRGEQRAMRGLSQKAKSRITPLIEFVSVPIDLKTRQPKKPVARHIDDGLDALVENWGQSDPFFIDPADVASTGGAQRVFSGAATRRLRFIPVTGLYRGAQEITAAVRNSPSGLCIRISTEDFARTSVNTDIASFVSTHSLSEDAVDIVVDLGAMEGQRPFAVSSVAAAALANIPVIDKWRTLTLLSSSFPVHMGKVPKDGSVLVHRSDFGAWSALRDGLTKAPRVPTFGDYGIQHPTGVEGYDPRYMGMAAAIRYTLAAEWLLIKGQDKKAKPLTVQFPALAKKLAGSGHYLGRSHCGGCECAYQCSKNKPGFGSAEAWRRIGTQHHLEFVTEQLAAESYP